MKTALLYLLTCITTIAFGQSKPKLYPAMFLPKGYVVFEKVVGDLNKDGLEDCVLIIKGTNKNNIITDEFRGQLDRNRRGIIVLFRKNDRYELAVKNYDCFSSENEDGGVYYAPDLVVDIVNGNLCISYGHGRYGYWKYTFRFQTSDFTLIGYDAGYKSSFESDYVTFDEESFNLLSKKKLVKKVIKVTNDGKEVYQDTWKNIIVNQSIKLSGIKNFDELDIEQIAQEN